MDSEKKFATTLQNALCVVSIPSRKLEGGIAPKDLDMEDKFGTTLQNPLCTTPKLGFSFYRR
ncbi:unnamed protein product [Camellia sinensis]